MARSAALLAVAVAVVAAATTASAAGFDLRGADTHAPAIASGHSTIVGCSETAEVALSHVLVPSTSNPGSGNGGGGGSGGGGNDSGRHQEWVVDGVDVIGPADLATSCDGWEITVAVELKDGSAVITSTEQLRSGEALPALTLETHVPKEDASRTAVLLTPATITVPLTGGGS